MPPGRVCPHSTPPRLSQLAQVPVARGSSRFLIFHDTLGHAVFRTELVLSRVCEMSGSWRFNIGHGPDFSLHPMTPNHSHLVNFDKLCV